MNTRLLKHMPPLSALVLMLVLPLAVSCAKTGEKSGNLKQLERRYHALMAEAESLEKSGVDVPEEQIKRVQTELKKARRERNPERAEKVLKQAEAKLAELRRRSAATDTK